ncbi:hypothetical protein N7474_003735 [Penicillium riverlandense]|uniref:uncharacterized protein n=1 Tax=Penicillium riverlandense TaxID=1903569 RepID=UPI00254912C6|nr:uncharacterized protein N7474_003735 [Penicillium riverlandense]KAJ5818144.1 hypothetical protein N7474_003735 [Penicillium riverlandense]
MSGHSAPSSLPSRIASLVHAQFDALPKRSKPTIFPDGSREWIPMTGIVAVKGENTPAETLTCIAVTSGAKCLPASLIPKCRGLVLHDFHAEILALRAFNYWLLTECRSVLIQEEHETSKHHPNANMMMSGSPFIRRRENDEHDHGIKWPPFEIQPDVKVYMYCTCAPCGDASMELCMAAQEDATPWEVRRPDPEIGDGLLDGRAHFSLLGVVRRKPSRMDAESTRSKSCSDKLALRQVSSLLSWETSMLVAPTENAYLAGLILPEDEISRVACDRSFGETGRMQALVGRTWPETPGSATSMYQFRPFEVLSVPEEEINALWRFAKPKSGMTDAENIAIDKKCKPSNTCAIWTSAPSFSHPCATNPGTGIKTLPTLCRSKTGLYETIINGVKQGNRATTPLPRGASYLSRAELWALVREIVQRPACHSCQDGVGFPDLSFMKRCTDEVMTYRDLKRGGTDLADPLRVRGQAVWDTKQVLKGWIPNAGDESWGLDVLEDPKRPKC